MEKNDRIRDRKKVGAGPNNESIFYVKVELENGTFRHYLGCPKLKRVFEILGQTQEILSSEKLKKDVSLFKEILETE